MPFPNQWSWLPVGVFVAAIGSTGVAQVPGSNNYTAIQAHPGEPVQLGYYASANKDCSPAPLPTVRVIQVPRSGVLSVRRGVLTTDKVAGCPGLKTPAQITFYEGRAGSTGTDHLIYEVVDFNGEVGVYDVTVEITESAKPSVPGKEQPL
jgi:hypothetical protein